MSLLTVRSGPAVVITLLSMLTFTPRCSALAQEQSTGPRPEQVRDVSSQAGETTKRITSALPDAPQTNTTQVPPSVRLDFRQRIHIYRHSMANFETVLAPAFGAAVIRCLMSLPSGAREPVDTAPDSRLVMVAR